MRREKFVMLGLILILSLAGCSSSLIQLRVETPPPKVEVSSIESTKTVNDHDSVSAGASENEFEEVEFYYALGVASNQEGKWIEAQELFERALELLANLDLEEADSLRELRVQMLLNEIAGDYKITLLSLGVLSDESSISAFLERFENIENFKALQKGTEEQIAPPTQEVTYDIPIEWNERVENAIVYFQTVGRRAFTTYMKRSGKYKDLMQSILRERGLPEDLVWLCLVESGFNPKAYSWARAVGPWQFIASTGKKYGLKRNWWYDERRDFVKSTYAACDYLTFLYDKFNSWPLALAGYNGGEGSVERAIKKHETEDFWRLRLRKQTEDYVPLYMAATIIAKDPERYGFDLEYDEPLQFEEVEINQPLDLKKVAKMLGVSPDAILELNQELLRGVTPPNYHGYKLRIPAGTKQLFASSFKEEDTKPRGLFVEHKVASGQTLSYLSQKYGVPVSAIMELNGLTSKNRLSVGQRLIIPTNNNVVEAKAKVKPNLSEKKKSSSTTYIVKAGDTLSELALKFNTTAQELKRLNGLKNMDRINKGQKLKVPGESAKAVKSFKEHIVKRGETLGHLATKYGVSVSELMSANNLSSAHRLKAGQPLLIPVASESDATSKSYTVKEGDTLSELALKFQTDAEKIKMANGLVSVHNIQKGQRLSIPIESDNASKTGRWVTYVVKKGDTLWDIAKAFGVLLEKLMVWNNLTARSKLQIGDRIRIFLTN